MFIASSQTTARVKRVITRQCREKKSSTTTMKRRHASDSLATMAPDRSTFEYETNPMPTRGCREMMMACKSRDADITKIVLGFEF